MVRPVGFFELVVMDQRSEIVHPHLLHIFVRPVYSMASLQPGFGSCHKLAARAGAFPILTLHPLSHSGSASDLIIADCPGDL